MAEHLIKTCVDIDSSFGPGAPFEFLVRRSVQKSTGANIPKFNPHWIGLLSALWTAIAEQHRKELFDVPNFFAGPEERFYTQDFKPEFFSSVRERSASAFSQRTNELLDGLWKDDPEEKVAIFLSKSCVPKHPWNADFLIDRFLRLTLAKGNMTWASCFSEGSSKAVAKATEITDWALNVDTKTADLDVIRLAGITITCLLAVTNSTVRDQATKALVNLMLGSPALFLDARSYDELCKEEQHDRKASPDVALALVVLRVVMVLHLQPQAILSMGGMEGIGAEASLFRRLRPEKPGYIGAFALKSTYGATADLDAGQTHFIDERLMSSEMDSAIPLTPQENVEIASRQLMKRIRYDTIMEEFIHELRPAL